MGIFTGLLLLMLPGVFCSIEDEIPSWVKCPLGSSINAFFPHACNCSKFYHCGNGITYEKDCPPDLYWNTYLVTCDYPDNSGCFSPTCPDDHSVVYHMNSRHCNYYYKCEDGIRQCERCPVGLHWNNIKFQCELPCKAGCKEGIKLRQKLFSELSPLNTSKSFTCPHSESSYTTSLEDPENCRAFYTCKKGVATHRQCPVSLYYNSLKSTCDFRSNVNCQIEESECEGTTVE